MAFKIVESPTGSGKTSWPAAAPFYQGGRPSPASLGLPHDTWRLNQLETLDWITGGKWGRVTALVCTKSLQAANYDQTYGFAAHYGRSNYECIKNLGRQCDQCQYLDTGMKSCPEASECLYLISKVKAWRSNKASLNYAYWLVAKNWRIHNAPDYLFLDEAHNLSEIVTNWSGVTVDETERDTWDLPEFPDITHDSACEMLGLDEPVDIALKWLHKCLIELDGVRPDGNLDLARKLERIQGKMRATVSALNTCRYDWYVRSGNDLLERWVKRGHKRIRVTIPGLVVKPLTAKHHFKSLFTGDYTTVAMSATIGDFQTFCDELGINEYDSRAVPNQWSPESRPIYVLDVPKMGYKKNESQRERELRFDKQAQEIAKFIQQWPSNWCGLIHVTRKSEEIELCKRLGKLGLDNRVWCVPGKTEGYIPTNKQLVAWEQRKRKVPSSLLITCSFSEGYDGLDEKINISAKIPFPNVGKPGSYDHAWMRYSRQRYDQVAATVLAQQQGRNRRGRPQDYDKPGEPAGANAIADGSFERVFEKLPAGLKEAIAR